MEKTEELKKTSYVNPTIKQVVLTANERVAVCVPPGSDPEDAPGGCGAFAPSAVPDDPVS